jgi:hypothetical protein
VLNGPRARPTPAPDAPWKPVRIKRRCCWRARRTSSRADRALPAFFPLARRSPRASDPSRRAHHRNRPKTADGPARRMTERLEMDEFPSRDWVRFVTGASGKIALVASRFHVSLSGELDVRTARATCAVAGLPTYDVAGFRTSAEAGLPTCAAAGLPTRAVAGLPTVPPQSAKRAGTGETPGRPGGAVGRPATTPTEFEPRNRGRLLT